MHPSDSSSGVHISCPLLKKIEKEVRQQLKSGVAQESYSNIKQEMSSAMSAIVPSNFIAMLESATAEERAQIGVLFGDMVPKKAPKEKKEPSAPVLAPGWILKPYEKGAKKGQDRWYNEENDQFSDVFPETRPSAGKAKAPAGGADLPDKKRLSKEEKAALSPEQKKLLKATRAAASAARKAARTPEEQAKIDARVAKMKAARAAKKAAAGGAGESASDEEEEA
jgi:hypothetical protein